MKLQKLLNSSLLEQMILTQMTFGYSRDDAGKFLPIYIEKGILEA